MGRIIFKTGAVGYATIFGDKSTSSSWCRHFSLPTTTTRHTRPPVSVVDSISDLRHGGGNSYYTATSSLRNITGISRVLLLDGYLVVSCTDETLKMCG